MVVWDKGVFLNELLKQGIVLNTNDNGAIDGSLEAKRGLTKGTFAGTSMALTEIYSKIEDAAASHFDAKGFEPIIPQKRVLKQKQQRPGGVGWIFDQQKIGFIKAIGEIFRFIIPDEISAKGTPFAGPTLADCEKYNRDHPSPKTDIMNGENLGTKVDWYSDARFAQQHLSSVNPTTIETARPEKVKTYIDEAGKQGLESMKKLLSEGKTLLIQDYSYFREATGVSNEQVFENVVPELDKDRKPTGKAVRRYACALVVIFQLHDDGRLHPLAITLDYRGTLDKSITIFNRRLTPDDKGNIDEKDDWPWRYAKTCAQTADWARHEIAVHLVDTHMIEDAIIVATNRTIPEEHLLYEILSPHWFRTLALNAAARAVLVPGVIARLAGFGPSIDPGTSRAFEFISASQSEGTIEYKVLQPELTAVSILI